MWKKYFEPQILYLDKLLANMRKKKDMWESAWLLEINMYFTDWKEVKIKNSYLRKMVLKKLLEVKKVVEHVVYC